MNAGAPIFRTVFACAACGAKHAGLSFLPLAQPIQQGEQRVTHRGVCPRTHRDIFIERRSKQP
jgi:hypothetical protein